jgi:hypothetical protein
MFDSYADGKPKFDRMFDPNWVQKCYLHFARKTVRSRVKIPLLAMQGAMEWCTASHLGVIWDAE